MIGDGDDDDDDDVVLYVGELESGGIGGRGMGKAQPQKSETLASGPQFTGLHAPIISISSGM